MENPYDPVLLMMCGIMMVMGCTYIYDAVHPGPTLLQPLELYENYTKNYR